MSKQTINFSNLISIIESATSKAKAKIEDLQSHQDNVSIGDMFEMQIVMNTLTQLSELSTAIVSASNSAIRSMAQNVNR
jgi:hypothetical protein